MTRVRTAFAIADAMSYLHSRRIVFRDLKPANVGFDAAGVLKLFDFGFAIGVDEEPESDPANPPCSEKSYGEEGDDESQQQLPHLLYDRCGTPRYMAPEVGLAIGYSLPADVYSFGILLWEICALKKPFGHVRSADEFQRTVFEKGIRPKMTGGRAWPEDLTDLIAGCWSADPGGRPAMSLVKSTLAAHARGLSMREDKDGGRGSMRSSSMFRRFTG